MSARAAWRLETLGFEDVWRYQPGKQDWFLARLPVAGSAVVRTAADAARPDVPACGPDERVTRVRRGCPRTGPGLWQS